jgi:hypothetical protein
VRFDPARVGVIAVGIEAYKFSDKTLNLNGPARHAVEFVKLAKDAGVAMENVRLFLSVGDQGSLDGALKELGIKDQVRDAGDGLENFLVQELPDMDCDLLYFYWCGHGAMQGPNRRLLYADAGDVRYHNLEVSALLQYLSSDRFKHTRQVGFVDACAERVGVQEERLAGPTPFWVANDPLFQRKRPQFFYYAAAPWKTAQSVPGTVYFSRAVLDVLKANPEQLLEPQPDPWKDAIASKFKELWPAEADDFEPVTFSVFADGHERSTESRRSFATADEDEMRRAADLRGWSVEVTSKLVKELADILSRRDAVFRERLCARFHQITNLTTEPLGSAAVRLLCGAILEKKLEAFLAGLREISEESVSAQTFEQLCRHADEAADLRRKADAIGWSLAKWQTVYNEWMDRETALPQTLDSLMFESLNSCANEDGAGVVYLAERAAQETGKESTFVNYCRQRWPGAIPAAVARLDSRRKGNQNYITLELSCPRSEPVDGNLVTIERAWVQPAGDPQPRQMQRELLEERQRTKTTLGDRVYSVVHRLRMQHFRHVEDALIVVELIVEAPLLLCDPGMFRYDAGHVLSLYNVVFRWRDRLDPGEAWEARESWEELAGRTWTQVRPMEKVKCRWLPWDADNMVPLIRDHIQDAVKRESPRSLLVGLQPDNDYGKLSSVLGASGAPFVCWHAPGVKAGAADIPTLLGETVLEELPHALRKGRSHRNGLEHLTLLYDDPQRDPYRNES